MHELSPKLVGILHGCTEKKWDRFIFLNEIFPSPPPSPLFGTKLQKGQGGFEMASLKMEKL